MDRFASLVASVPFRIPFVLAGLAGLSLAVIVIVHVVRRVIGRGRASDIGAIAGRMYNGDLNAAAANVRTKFQYSLIFAVWSIVLVLIGVLGANFLSVQLIVLGGAVLATVVLWLWAWVEREFGRPGWFVPVEVRGSPGLRHAREPDANS